MFQTKNVCMYVCTYSCDISTIYTKLQLLSSNLPLCVLAVSTPNDKKYYTSRDCSVVALILRSVKSFNNIAYSSNIVCYAKLQEHAVNGVPLQKFAQPPR
jgi:hypothetical protein